MSPIPNSDFFLSVSTPWRLFINFTFRQTGTAADLAPAISCAVPGDGDADDAVTMINDSTHTQRTGYVGGTSTLHWFKVQQAMKIQINPRFICPDSREKG